MQISEGIEMWGKDSAVGVTEVLECDGGLKGETWFSQGGDSVVYCTE